MLTTLNAQKDIFVSITNVSAEAAKMTKIVTSTECFVTSHPNRTLENAERDVPSLRFGQNGVDAELTKSVNPLEQGNLIAREWVQESVNRHGTLFIFS